MKFIVFGIAACAICSGINIIAVRNVIKWMIRQ